MTDATETDDANDDGAAEPLLATPGLLITRIQASDDRGSCNTSFCCCCSHDGRPKPTGKSAAVATNVGLRAHSRSFWLAALAVG